MKKFISILTAIAILFGMCVSASAEFPGGVIEDITAGDIEITADTNYFIRGESFIMTIYVGVANVIDIESAEIYIDCNKDVLKYTGDISLSSTANTSFSLEETDTGYLVTYICTPDAAGCMYNFAAYCAFEITGTDTPDISVRGAIKPFNGKSQKATVLLSLPENTVYEKDDIPHIVTSLKPPVFGEGVTFNTSGRIYVFAPQTVEQIKAMLSSSDGVSEIEFAPCNDIERDYVTTGDSFVLEFGGRKCDEIFVEVRGDADADGLITSKDARLALRFSAGLEEKRPDYADINYDNDINAADARMLLRVAARLDYFRHKNIVVWENQIFRVGPLTSASDGGYMWRCTVSEPDAVEITEEITQSVDNTGKPPLEIIYGAPALQTFTLKVKKMGTYDVHFELIRPWESVPIAEFGFTIIADDVLN